MKLQKSYICLNHHYSPISDTQLMLFLLKCTKYTSHCFIIPPQNFILYYFALNIKLNSLIFYNTDITFSKNMTSSICFLCI